MSSINDSGIEKITNDFVQKQTTLSSDCKLLVQNKRLIFLNIRNHVSSQAIIFIFLKIVPRGTLIIRQIRAHQTVQENINIESSSSTLKFHMEH